MNTTCVSPFPVTQWTAIVDLRNQGTPEEQRRALDKLCRDYWYPLYSFARRSGKRRPDAEDLTQGFFGYLLEKDLFASANQELGKLRTFLLTAFQRYMGGVRDRENAEKRGGGQPVFSLDVDEAERHFGEPSDTLTPHEIYDRQWALSVLGKSLEALAKSEKSAARFEQYVLLEPFLNPRTQDEGNYESAALALGTTQEAARKAVSRLRSRFRDLLRQQIAETLRFPSESQIDEELLALKNALR